MIDLSPARQVRMKKNSDFKVGDICTDPTLNIWYVVLGVPNKDDLQVFVLNDTEYYYSGYSEFSRNGMIYDVVVEEC